MVKLLTGSSQRKTLLLFFLLAVLYWIVFVVVSGYKQHPLGLYTQLPLIVIPIFGGLVGLTKAKKWGGFQSVMGRASLGLSLGMSIWGVALGIWTFYIAQGDPLPYPSLADYIFVLSQLLYIYGFAQLSKAVGASFGIRNSRERWVSAIMTILVAAFSYYILVVIAHGNSVSAPQETPMQIFFDYAYTIGTLIIVTIVGALYSFSRKYLGGKYKTPVLFLFIGFLVHFAAIFFFVSTLASGTYFNGNIADILFTIAVFIESLGIINLDPKMK